MTSRFRLAVLGLALALSGCATVPLSSIAALSGIQMETTDLATFRIAMRLPGALRPAPDGVRLHVTTRVDGDPERAEVFALVPSADPADLADLGQRIDPGYSVHVFALSPEGRAGLDAVRQSIGAARVDGRRGSLSLGATLEAFCVASALPEGPLYATTLIRTSETGRFVVLTDRVEMRGSAEFASALAQVQPCATP